MPVVLGSVACVSAEEAPSSGVDDRPYAAMLLLPPAALTVLSQANGGEFPTRQVERPIDRRTMPGAHGTRTIPIWVASENARRTVVRRTSKRG